MMYLEARFLEVVVVNTADRSRGAGNQGDDGAQSDFKAGEAVRSQGGHPVSTYGRLRRGNLLSTHVHRYSNGY